MRHPAPLPAALRGAPFATRVAVELGVPPKRMRARDLVAPFHAVRTAEGDLGIRELCAAYLQRAGDDEFFSHVTAAVLLGIPLPRALESRRVLDVSVVAPGFPPQAAGVAGHRLSRAVPTWLVEGLPCVRPIEAFVQLAAVLPLDELVVVGDALVRRKRPLATLEEVGAAAAASARRPGARRLRSAIPLVRAGTDSPMETRMRLAIVRGGLPEPVIGHTVNDEDGYFVGTPDLAYVRERIAIEYEGDVHRTDPRVFADDIERREMFRDAGWCHVRVTAPLLATPHRLVNRLARLLADPH